MMRNDLDSIGSRHQEDLSDKRANGLIPNWDPIPELITEVRELRELLDDARESYQLAMDSLAGNNSWHAMEVVRGCFMTIRDGKSVHLKPLIDAALGKDG